MLFKDFEFRPSVFLDEHTDPFSFDLVKWYDHEPIKTANAGTTSRSCYTVAIFKWSENDYWWDIELVGTRLFEYWEHGLDKFIKSWCEYAGACMEYVKKDG